MSEEENVELAHRVIDTNLLPILGQVLLERSL
jgi:hypothetical protein